MYLIGIVGRVSRNVDNQDIIQITDSLRRAFMRMENVVCVSLLPTESNNIASIEPGYDTVNNKIDFLLDKCDAFVVPGGTDYYKFDEYVINYAIKNDKPLLAICLGFQLLCTMFAKKRDSWEIVRKLNNESHCGKPNSYQHKNSIIKNTKLFDIIGTEIIEVNSTHHYVVDFPMNDLIINSNSEDGIIEGVELPGKSFVLGIQWHPEYLMDENSLKIFNSFINAIKK